MATSFARALSRRSVITLAVGLLVSSSFLTGSIYTARGDNHETTFYACLYAGALSQVSTTPPASCGRGQQIQWNAEGGAGADGINCWDLNGNGVNDPDEDINGDTVFDALDCQGPPGPSNALDCDGCVDTSDLATGAVTTSKLTSHVAVGRATLELDTTQIGNPASGTVDVVNAENLGPGLSIKLIVGQARVKELTTTQDTAFHYVIWGGGTPLGDYLYDHVPAGGDVVVPFTVMGFGSPNDITFRFQLVLGTSNAHISAEIDMYVIDLGRYQP